MRSVGHIATLIVAVAAILGLSAGQLLKERHQILDELVAAQTAQAEAAAHAIEEHFQALERDTRILANLVSRNRRASGFDIATENRVIHEAFDALVSVVPHYRTLALYEADGTASVTAADPTEADVVPALLFERGRRLALTMTGDSPAMLTVPVATGDERFLFLVARPAGPREVMVVSIDAPVLMQDVLPPASPDARHLVLDPSGTAWTGCERTQTCRPSSDRSLATVLHPATGPATRWLTAGEASSVGLSSAAPALLASARAPSLGGAWSLAIVTSAARFAARQNALLRGMLLTGLAAALAVVAVGLFILRQQRRSAALQERLHTAQELATLREKSDAIVENAPIGILGASDDGKVVIANRFLADRMGPIEVGHGWQQAFSAAFTEGAAHLRALLAEAQRSPGGRLDQREVALVAPGAKDFDVRIVSLSHPADEVHQLALIEDRSQLRNLERQLVRAEKILTVGVLTAGLAHEIGTPISVIRGRAENLLDSLAGTPAAEDLAVIVRHADRIASTIRQVLDFSRAQPIQVGPVEPAGALERVRRLLDWKLASKRLSFRIAVAADAAPLSADADQLEQVLVNLILNACDACAEGGNIRAEAAPAPDDPGQVRLDIHDDGCGVPVENLNAIFDPFFTTKKRGEGTGLGLTVAASIVRNHGGALTVASVPGQGTTFSLFWPAVSSGKAHA